MKKKRHDYSSFVLITIIVLFVTSYFFLDLKHTGYVVYEENSYTWDFSDQNDYVYDNINFTSNEIKLNQLTNVTPVTNNTENSVELVLAISHNTDVTDKVSSLDNKKAEVKKNKVFNVTFLNNLDNGDAISLYAKKSDGTSIASLCDEDAECGGTNYGSIEVNDDTFKWYTITVSNLQSPTNKFNIDTDKTFKVDYINATHYETNEYNEIDSYYAQNGSIETEDLEVSNLGYWNIFSYEETLNNQEINHYYSTDSGGNWALIEYNNLSSIPTDSGKIRFKSELLSNTTLTPLLNQLSVTYKTTVVCIENWTANYGLCNDNKKLLYYTDENSCGIIQNLPDDNGTYLDCASGQEGQSSSTGSGGGGSSSSFDKTVGKVIEAKECGPEWSCDEWSSCIDNVQTRTCTDKNNCNKIAGKPPTKQDCLHEDEENGIERNASNETLNSEDSNEEPTQRSITGQAVYLLRTNDSTKILSLISLLIIFLVLHFVYLKFKNKK